MSYPGTAPPRPSSDRTATLVTSVIGLVALVAVLLIAVITSDSGGSALGQGEQDTGYGSASGPAVSGGSSGGTDSEGGSSGVSIAPAPTPSQVTSSPVEPSAGSASRTNVAPAPHSSASAGTAQAARLRATFPTPPHTRKVKSYASLSKPKAQDWYVSTSSLATVHAFYVTLFKKSGWTTYIRPSVYKDSSGRINGFFSIYHLHEQVTADLSLDRNYLGEKPGTVLIRTEISDD